MMTYLRTKDYFHSQETFELLLNENLDMLITKPVPDDLTYYYNNASYVSHTDKSKSLIDKLYFLVKQYSLKRKVNMLSSLMNKKEHLLDIGAGTGDFLIAAKNAGYTTTGVEPNSLARKNALNKGMHLYADINDTPISSYPVVTLWHVLEHLPNLDREIARITNLVTPEGYLLIAVPNYKSHDATHYGPYWAAYDVPRHLYHFSKHSIMSLLQPHGFTLIRTKPMWFDSFYVSLLSEKYKTGKHNYITAFYRGMISNLKGLSTNEYSSHIYVLQKRNSKFKPI